MPSGHKSITDIELLNPGVQIVHKDDKSPHLVQLRQLPVFKPENMLNYSREELWGFFLALENEEERRLLSKMGKTYEQANTAWKKVSQDETLRQQRWYLETIRTDYLIDIQTAEERGEERGEKRGEKRGVKIGEERAEERKRVQLLDSLLGLCHELQLSLTDDQQHKLQNLSFEKLLELQVHIAIQKILPKDF